MYPKTPGCFSDLSAALYYKSYCFFLKLLIVLPVHFPLLHFTPPKVLRFYYNLTFRCVRYFGGSAGMSSQGVFLYLQSVDYFPILFRISLAATTPDTAAWIMPLVIPAPSPAAKRFLTSVSRLFVSFSLME